MFLSEFQRGVVFGLAVMSTTLLVYMMARDVYRDRQRIERARAHHRQVYRGDE